MEECGTNTMAPMPLTMDRLEERDEVVMAQSTSQCCRTGCCQPSINWLIAEGNNFKPGSNPYKLDSVGWIHEESKFAGRLWSCCAAGCRSIKYVQHHGPPPASMMKENVEWCTCQFDEATKGLTKEERTTNIVAIHEKKQTCGVFCCWTPCVCNGFGLPYLETKDPATGNVLGRTQYVCDMCCFVPKYDILDGKTGTQLYRLRPDTCLGGLCVKFRYGGKKGKCCRVPFIVRHPETQEPVISGATTLAGTAINAMVDVLWSGWANECCMKKNAYHVSFPRNIKPEHKAVLLGSTLLVDVTMFEQEQDDN